MFTSWILEVKGRDHQERLGSYLQIAKSGLESIQNYRWRSGKVSLRGTTLSLPNEVIIAKTLIMKVMSPNNHFGLQSSTLFIGFLISQLVQNTLHLLWIRHLPLGWGVLCVSIQSWARSKEILYCFFPSNTERTKVRGWDRTAGRNKLLKVKYPPFTERVAISSNPVPFSIPQSQGDFSGYHDSCCKENHFAIWPLKIPLVEFNAYQIQFLKHEVLLVLPTSLK